MGTIYVKMCYISAGLRAGVGHNSPAFSNGSPFDSYNAQEYQNRSREEFDGPISGVKFLNIYITTDHLGSLVGVVDARGILPYGMLRNRSVLNDQGDCGSARDGVGIQGNLHPQHPIPVDVPIYLLFISLPPVIGPSFIPPISRNWGESVAGGLVGVGV